MKTDNQGITPPHLQHDNQKPDTTLRAELADLTAQWAAGREDHIKINDAILDLLLKRLPGEKSKDRPHHMSIYDEGYNQALSEVRAIIEGE